MTESKLYPGSFQIPPMKYGNKPSETQVLASWESGEWIAQEKKDGAWYQLEKTDDGKIYLFGRTLSKKTGEYTEKIDNVPHIKDWAEKLLPNGTILIGEIYVVGGKSNDVTKIMGCTAANAYKRQFETEEYGGPIHYYVFDCIRYKGQDLCDKPTIERYNYLNNELKDLFFRYEKDKGYVSSIAWVYKNVNDYALIELARVYEDNFEEHLNNIFNNGGEGMVFKKKDCPYRPGKRTTVSQMYKYKEHLDSVDLVCMELLDPEPYYTGKELDTWPYWGYRRYIDGYVEKGYWEYVPYKQLGYPKESLGWEIVPLTKHFWSDWKNAIRLGAYKDGELVEVGRVASGLTDELREDMADNPDNYLGKVIEVECMSTTADGALRHPVFIRVRDDKSPQDCKWEEIFN